MWRVCKEAGRPWPVLSEDPLLDYMVMEAVAVKIKKEDEKAQKDADEQAQRKEFKKAKQQELREFVG